MIRPSAIVMVSLGLVLSCGGGAKPKAKKPTVTTKKKAPPPGKLGDACAPGDVPFSRGTCTDALICAPFPGGYCASMCPCGDGGACVDSPRAGEICEKSCQTDGDCRAAEGYVCDPQWKTCTVPGFLAPRAPTCDPAPKALARKAFGKVTQLSTSNGPGISHTEVAAALTRSGDLLAVFIGVTKMEPNVLGSSTMSVKGAVVGDNELGFGKKNHFDPWLSSDRAGTLYLAYLGYDGGSPEKDMTIGLVSSENGQKWSEPVAAFDPADCPSAASGCLDKPMVVVGPQRADPKKDAVYVFYYSNSKEKLRVVRSDDGGKTFGAGADVGSGAYGDVDITASGRLHVAYVTGDGDANRFGDAGNKIEYVKNEDGGATWSAPVVVSGEGENVPFYFSNAQILADAKNAILYVVYPAGTPDGKWNIVLAYSKDGGVKWERQIVNDDAACASHMLPSAALDEKSGKVHVTWVENRNGKGQLAWSTCVAGKKCAANEAVSEGDFAAYSFARHSSRWLGDYNALVVDDKKRVIHAVWAQPVDESGTIVTRVFTASAKLK